MGKIVSIIIDIIIVIIGFICANFLMEFVLNVLDKTNLIGEDAGLLVLCIPFIIYGFVLLGLVPCIIRFINKKSNNKELS